MERNAAGRPGKCKQADCVFGKQKGKEEQLFKVQTAIEAFDSDIQKISVDAIATQRIIEQLKRERKSARNGFVP